MSEIIKPGDYVVCLEPIEETPYKKGDIVQIEDVKITEHGYGYRIKGRYAWWCDGANKKWKFQHIQDYFQPGDEVKIIYRDGDHEICIVRKWDNDRLWFTDGEYEVFNENTDHSWIETIRNLTKEKQEKEANMAMTKPVASHHPCKTNSRVNKPTHLTDKDLVALGNGACKEGKDAFYKEFGSEVKLTEPRFKTFLKEHGLEKYVKDHFPVHYAVVFPEWQPTINEIVWVNHKWVGRVIRELVYDEKKYSIASPTGEIYYLYLEDIKPISERLFQIEDLVKVKKTGHIFEIVADEAKNTDISQFRVSRANAFKDEIELIISPAIPEVK